MRLRNTKRRETIGCLVLAFKDIFLIYSKNCSLLTDINRNQP